MGSLNGDIMVMRNGRSTSQVSVYNYPEHLNPFYEDDQHKRLRFWKISKKDNEGRRNSFSISNLKEMWAFKPFRMKKKSSTLGINKTSESPPLLRRDYVLDNGWNTFDHRLRASNTPSINSESFQRNATYRSSLQTLPTCNDRIGLNRNDGYRSTIQVPRSYPRYQPQQKQQQQLQQTVGVSHNRRYVYGGSITPQPMRNSRTYFGRGPHDYDSDNDIIRGSSQSSMMSTNPFESDDEESADINSNGMRSEVNGSTTTLTSRTPRKKRRAPAPPTPIHGCINGAPLPTIRIEPSHDDAQDDLQIKEDIDILAAEIESFVKTKSNDDVEVNQKGDGHMTPAAIATTIISDNKETDVVIDKQEITGKIKVIHPAPNNVSAAVNATEDIDAVTKEKTNMVEKANGQTTIESETKTTATADVNKPVKKQIETIKISNKTEIKIVEGKEIKTNGAIPKKPINNAIDEQHQQQQSAPLAEDLCIKETCTEELPQKPVPLKRVTKQESEVGHVECIHVHVESPKATPRKDHSRGLSSFKANETVESTDETITTKTPFVLTSPPIQRRNLRQTQQTEPITKETVKIVETTATSQRTNELNIKEEPEILVKPALSPKPVTKESNGKNHGFAEIHKPMRRNAQNSHIRKTSRDGSISPPFIPQHKFEEQEEKIHNINNFQTNGINTKKGEVIKQNSFETVDNLKIIETATSVNGSGDFESVKDETRKRNEIIETTVSTSANSKEAQKLDDDLLYRPKPASHMEWKRSTLAPLETNIPPEKRKSVKDIIESINRSQRLLNAAANKDFPALQNQNTKANNVGTDTVTTPQSPFASNNNNLNENLKILNERQEEIQRFVEEMTPSTNSDDLAAATNSPSPSPSNCNNECTETQKPDNNEIFQKCKVNKEVYDYRETSPITSNLDWNPVPKPKRTTKSAHE